MGLLGHLLVRASPTVTDAAMSSTRDVCLDGDDADSDHDFSTASQLMLTKLSDRIGKTSYSSLDPLPSPGFDACLQQQQPLSRRMSFQRFGSTNDSNILESISEDPMSESQEVILPDILGAEFYV